MIDLRCDSRQVNYLRTTNIKLKHSQLFAMGKVTAFKDAFHFASKSNLDTMLDILQDLCENNNCSGLVISPYEISGEKNLKYCKKSVYLEIANDFEDVIRIIRSIESPTIVLINGFDTLYHNNMYVGSTTFNGEYCMDKLVTVVANSKACVMVDSQLHSLTTFKTAVFVAIEGRAHLLLENQQIIPIDEIVE